MEHTGILVNHFGSCGLCVSRWIGERIDLSQSSSNMCSFIYKAHILHQ